MTEIIYPYCYVKGCENEVESGGPRPALCNSCYFLLRDGPDKDTVGESFIHDLINERDQLKWRNRNACVAMDGGGYLSVDDLIQIYCRYYELTKPNHEVEDATSKPLWKNGFSFGYDKGYADAQRDAAEGKPVDDGRFQAYTEGFWRGFDMGYDKAGKVSKE